MPVPGYMTINGTKQGNISQGAFTADSVGNNWVEGHEDECLVQAFTNGVVQPRDPQSGQPTGTRVHKPATFTKVFDKASPLLWQALCAGEILQLELKFYRTAQTGQQEHYFSIKWTDCTLVDGQGFFPNCLDPANSNFTHMEDWSFVYRKVEWTHEKAGTTGSDDWRKPMTA